MLTAASLSDCVQDRHCKYGREYSLHKFLVHELEQVSSFLSAVLPEIDCMDSIASFSLSMRYIRVVQVLPYAFVCPFLLLPIDRRWLS